MNLLRVLQALIPMPGGPRPLPPGRDAGAGPEMSFPDLLGDLLVAAEEDAGTAVTGRPGALVRALDRTVASPVSGSVDPDSSIGFAGQPDGHRVPTPIEESIPTTSTPPSAGREIVGPPALSDAVNDVVPGPAIPGSAAVSQALVPTVVVATPIDPGSSSVDTQDPGVHSVTRIPDGAATPDDVASLAETSGTPGFVRDGVDRPAGGVERRERPVSFRASDPGRAITEPVSGHVASGTIVHTVAPDRALARGDGTFAAGEGAGGSRSGPGRRQPETGTSDVSTSIDNDRVEPPRSSRPATVERHASDTPRGREVRFTLSAMPSHSFGETVGAPSVVPNGEAVSDRAIHDTVMRRNVPRGVQSTAGEAPPARMVRPRPLVPEPDHALGSTVGSPRRVGPPGLSGLSSEVPPAGERASGTDERKRDEAETGEVQRSIPAGRDRGADAGPVFTTDPAVRNPGPVTALSGVVTDSDTRERRLAPTGADPLDHRDTPSVVPAATSGVGRTIDASAGSYGSSDVARKTTTGSGGGHAPLTNAPGTAPGTDANDSPHAGRVARLEALPAMGPGRAEALELAPISPVRGTGAVVDPVSMPLPTLSVAARPPVVTVHAGSSPAIDRHATPAEAAPNPGAPPPVREGGVPVVIPHKRKPVAPRADPPRPDGPAERTITPSTPRAEMSSPPVPEADEGRPGHTRPRERTGHESSRPEIKVEPDRSAPPGREGAPPSVAPRPSIGRTGPTAGPTQVDRPAAPLPESPEAAGEHGPRVATITVPRDDGTTARVRISVHNGVVNTRIVHPDPTVAGRLARSADELHRAMADRGFTDSRVSVLGTVRPDAGPHGTDAHRSSDHRQGTRQDQHSQHDDAEGSPGDRRRQGYSDRDRRAFQQREQSS